MTNYRGKTACDLARDNAQATTRVIIEKSINKRLQIERQTQKDVAQAMQDLREMKETLFLFEKDIKMQLGELKEQITRLSSLLHMSNP